MAAGAALMLLVGGGHALLWGGSVPSAALRPEPPTVPEPASTALPPPPITWEAVLRARDAAAEAHRRATVVEQRSDGTIVVYGRSPDNPASEIPELRDVAAGIDSLAVAEQTRLLGVLADATGIPGRRFRGKPTELWFGCAGGSTAESSTDWAALLRCTTPAVVAIAARALWEGCSRRYAGDVLERVRAAATTQLEGAIEKAVTPASVSAASTRRWRAAARS